MNLNQKITASLQPLGHPASPYQYTGDAATYFTFRYSTAPAQFADNVPQMERFFIQVRLHCPIEADTTELQAAVKQTLFAAGFTWPEMENLTDETGQLLNFKCEWLEGINAGETA